MTDLRDLYQEVILDHNRRPRNYGRPEGANRTADGHNPLCGDRITVHARLEGGTLAAIGFEGNGCAISKASASLMTEALKGKSSAEAEVIFELFHRMVTGRDAGGDDPARLGKLAVFEGVREFPARVKCASLAWHTLRAAIEERHELVSTE